MQREHIQHSIDELATQYLENLKKIDDVHRKHPECLKGKRSIDPNKGFSSWNCCPDHQALQYLSDDIRSKALFITQQLQLDIPHYSILSPYWWEMVGRKDIAKQTSSSRRYLNHILNKILP